MLKRTFNYPNLIKELSTSYFLKNQKYPNLFKRALLSFSVAKFRSSLLTVYVSYQTQGYSI